MSDDLKARLSAASSKLEGWMPPENEQDWACLDAMQVINDALATLEAREAEIVALKDEIETWKSVFPDIAPESVLPDR